MAIFQFRSATEQVADYLRSEIAQRRWSVQLPGSNALAKELGVGKSSIEGALGLLEAEGILIPQGAGRRRRIDLSKTPTVAAKKIQILLFSKEDRTQAMIIELERQLQVLGHAAVIAEKTLAQMGMSPQRVSRFVCETEADAWLVVAGSREVLEWFAQQARPAYAIFGRQASVEIAGAAVSRKTALDQALQHMVELGHRRIVLLSRPNRRKPEPGAFERYFLDRLAHHGIQSGPFNLPDWEDESASLRSCLDALFAHTPPTALIVDQSHLYFAVQQHLALRGVVAPRDVSMLCSETNPAFIWAHPMISHLNWDQSRLIKHVRRWVSQLDQGQESRRQSLIEASFVPGGTIGPVPHRSAKLV